MLLDIFCVKKAHAFTFEQRADYRVKDFEHDVQETKRLWNLGEIGISHFVKSDLLQKRLNSTSLYTRWLINDDLFDSMKWIFGVTHFVDRVQAKLSKGLRQSVHVYIIPKKVVSLYDPHEVWEMKNMSSIDQLLEYLDDDASVNFSSQRWRNSSAVEICDVMQGIHNRIQLSLGCDTNMIILVDRRRLDGTDDETQPLWIYESEDLYELLALSWNYFLGFEFDIGDNAKCWIRYGFGQRVRFYPEFLISLVPSLFVRPSEYSDMEYFKKIYDDQFKHGWAVALDDPIFNLYYKAITGDDHISNNYNRRKNVKKLNVDRSLGFLEFVRRQMNDLRFRSLQRLLLKHDMDSDAVFGDMMEEEKDSRVFIDVSDSNVARWTTADTIKHLRSAIFRWKNIQCKRDNSLDLRDCHHFNVVIDYLKTFQRLGNKVVESNLNQFNLEEVIQSLDHITSVHRLLDPEYRAEIHRYIANHVVCENLKCCETFRKYADRNRECDQNRVWKRRYKANDAEERCTVMMDVMNTLHSLLVHRDQTLNIERRLKRFFNSKEAVSGETTDAEAAIEEEKGHESVTNSIDLGVSVIRWIPFGESSHFQSFRDEIVCNPNGSIDEQLLQHYLIECSAKIYDTTFTLKEMMALKLYTDTTKLTASLRKAHWTTSPLSFKKLYYFWALTLYEAAVYHSVPIASGNTNAPVTLYHGINRMFTVNEDLPKYNGPFSTTTQRTIAHEFTKGQGLYFRMQPRYINKVKCCVGIKVENISCHQREREILLIDQYLPISSTKTFRDSDVAMVDYLIFSIRGWKIEIKDSHGFFIQLGIRFDPQWMSLIGSHRELFHSSVYRNRLVITRLIEELHITDWSLSFLNPNVDHVPLVTHLVEQCKMKQFLPHYRVATSKFHVIQSFVIDRCFEFEFIPNTKMDHIGNIDTTPVNDTCFKETQYLINGISAPYTTSKVEGAVHHIRCRNPDLFGDRDVWIQEFQSSNDYDSLESEIADLVENHHIHQLLPHYRVLTSKFTVIQSQQFDICFHIELIPNTKMDYIDDKVIVDDSCFRETEYKINRITVPYTVSSVNGAVHRIECRNIKLFGDGNVWVQGFQNSSKPSPHDSLRSEIIYMVEERQIHQLLPHYRVLTSKFNVIQSNCFDICYKIELIPNTKMDPIGDETTVNDSCFRETDYIIDGVNVPHPISASAVKAPIHRIQCRNTKLFGDRDIWIQIFQSSTNSKHYDSIEAEIIDLVQHHQEYQLLPHYRVLTSKFLVVQCISLDICFKVDFIPNTKMDHLSENGGDTLCFEESEYIIDGVSVPFTVSTIKGAVHRIQCRNTKLFGDRDVWVQIFGDQKDSDYSMESEIINLVEQHGVYQLLAHYRVLTSKFKVVCVSQRRSHLWFSKNTKLDDIVDCVNDVCFAETEYKINGKVVSHTVSSVKGIVKRIECRNFKLFGDRLVWVQEFDHIQDEKRLELAVLEGKGREAHDFDHTDDWLDEDKFSFYWSQRGVLASGWIIFEVKQKGSFYPTKLVIRNSACDNAIKSMVISSTENGEEYHEWTRIDNIQRGINKKQWFAFDPEESRAVFALRKMQYLRLTILENHGSPMTNKLHEFAIFGFSA